MYMLQRVRFNQKYNTTCFWLKPTRSVKVLDENANEFLNRRFIFKLYKTKNYVFLWLLVSWVLPDF